MSLEEDDVPIVIEALEDLVESFCGDHECENCTLKEITINSILQTLYGKAPKIEIKVEL